MTDCFECGCPIDPDHEPRIASGQTFHPTSGHCISALRIKLAERDRDADRLRAIADAATRADWEQVRLNGGPPCFHIEDGRFCFRAERWPGHPVYHPFTTLHDAARGEVSK